MCGESMCIKGDVCCVCGVFTCVYMCLQVHEGKE